MKYIQQTIIREIIINKSRFITSIYRINSTKEVDDILNDVKNEHISANHNCYAYIIGNNQDIQKCSDDGEPSKTAGFPMLEVLKKQELTNILAITTRYFGGVMLGSSGLIRTYSQSVLEALKKATFYRQEILEVYRITLDYAYYNTIINANLDVIILESNFLEKVTLKIDISKNKSHSVLKSLKNLTNAASECIFLHETTVEVQIPS